MCCYGFAGNIIDFGLWRDRSFAAANGTMMGFGLAIYGSIAILPWFVQGLLGYPVLAAEYLFMPCGLAAGFSMVFTGAVLMSRFDPRMLVMLGLLLTGLGYLYLGWFNLKTGFWDLTVPGLISGIGMGLFFVPMSTLAFQNIGSDRRDQASGIYGVMRSLGTPVGIAIVGWQVISRSQFHWSVLSQKTRPLPRSVGLFATTWDCRRVATGGRNDGSLVAAQSSMLAFQDAF